MNQYKKILSFLVVSCFLTANLFGQITSNTTIHNADVNSYSWPITISGGTAGSPVVVTLGDDISVATFTNYYFIIGSDYITINGNGHTITLNNITNYPGLVQNGTSGSNGYGNININKIGIIASGSTTLFGFGGWIGQYYFGKGQASATNTASKCYSTGAAIKVGGGIFGAYSNQATANDCYTITNGASSVGVNGGGIFGSQSTNCAANRCKSTGGGSMGSYAGGIFGSHVSNCVATSCFSDMIIYGGSAAGGIFGEYAANCTASKCYTTGDIGTDPFTNGYHGGIFGGYASNCLASTCFYTGMVEGADGGIFGAYSTSCTANACYGEGILGCFVDHESAGIFGPHATSGAAINCWINAGDHYGSSYSKPIFIVADDYTNGNYQTNCWVYFDYTDSYLSGAPLSLVGAPTTAPGLGTVWASNYNVETKNSYLGDYNNGSPFVFPNYWMGTTSTDWADASNWSRGFVPDAASQSNYVVIPPTANQPVIGSSTAAVAYTIVIQSGAVLNIAAGGSLTINNGSSVFTPGSGGSADFTVITDGGVITVNPGAAITGNYGGITGGTATLQENIVGQRGWRVFANPFSTAQTLATVATKNAINIQTTGSANAAGIGDDRIFSNATNLWTDGGTNIASNTAYGLFVRGLASEVTGLTYIGGPTAFTYKSSGTLNGNSIYIPSPLAGNFMVIGNPYAAPVKSQALTSQLAGSNYYTYQIAVTGTPRVKSGSWVPSGSASDATHTIPTLGVIAYLPATTLPFSITPNDINLSGTLQTGIFGIQSPAEQIELLLEQNGNYQDKLFVRLDANTRANGTDKKDLQKFYNDVVNVYTIAPDAKKLAIDARNVFGTIPLGMQAPVGDYNFKVANNSLPTGTVVYLKDNFLNTQTEIKEGDSYNFSITTDTASKGDYRFELTTETVKANSNNVEVSNGNFTAEILGNVTGSNTISVKIAGSKGPVSIRATELSGRNFLNLQTGDGIQTVPLGNISSGMLILQFSDGKSTITKKLIKF